jgi:hypothetical protein
MLVSAGVRGAMYAASPISREVPALPPALGGGLGRRYANRTSKAKEHRVGGGVGDGPQSEARDRSLRAP